MAAIPHPPYELAIPYAARRDQGGMLRGLRGIGLSAVDRDTGREWPRNARIVVEGQACTETLALVAGWACSKRLLSDGRRQILHILLPGDLLEPSLRRGEAAASTIVALTHARTITVPLHGEAIQEALRIAAVQLQCYLMNHMVRLGRQSAYERMAHLFLELHDRLSLAGLCAEDAFDLPLTQEMLADMLGLTNVHVNRTLQQMRREGVIDLTQRHLCLLNRGALETRSEYRSCIR